MRNLLPTVGSDGRYASLPTETLDAWVPGVKEIASRHGIRAATVSRFAKGEHPVFAVNERVVVKLLPRRSAQVARREVECLERFSRCATIPLPTLLGSGQLEDWSYLISTKLPGQPLSERWAALDGIGQESVAAE